MRGAGGGFVVLIGVLGGEEAEGIGVGAATAFLSVKLGNSQATLIAGLPLDGEG